MKTRIISIIAAGLMLAIQPLAMAQHEHHGNMNMDQSSMKQAHYQVSEAFQKQMSTLYETYINLKDALVSSNPTMAAERATMMKKQLGKVDMNLLEGEAHKAWMDHEISMTNQLTTMATSSSLESQRAVFAQLSETMYQCLKSFGMQGMKAYYQFCPMAMHGAGAHWLSATEEIKNPYFGDKMMKCGKTVEKF